MLPPLIFKAGVAVVFCVIGLSYMLNSTTFLARSSFKPSLSNPFNAKAIPNIVHYTQLMREPTADFKFEFKDFIAAYGASINLRPDTIYIHTDATDEAIARATESSGQAATNKWTRLIFQLPNVVVNKVHAPKRASLSGVPITAIEHQSDFVRMQVVYKYGGLYMDWDVHPLRDLRPLREAGFQNVVGRERGGTVNNGAWMAHKGTAMVEVWMKAAHAVFDGKWTTHSVKLLARVAERMVSRPGEVLIMDERAFAPSGWSKGDVNYLFGIHSETPDSSTAVSNATADAIEAALWQWQDPQDHVEWQADYSSSYLLHAFRAPKPGDLPGYEGITPEYVLARQSNFARAVYPVLRHAMDHGVLSAKDF